MPFRLHITPTPVHTLPGYTVDASGSVVTQQPSTAVVKIGSYTLQQTNTALWTPAAGKKFVITDIFVSVGTEGVVTLLDQADVIREYNLAQYGGAVENLETHYVSDTADNVLKISTSAAMVVFALIQGYEV